MEQPPKKQSTDPRETLRSGGASEETLRVGGGGIGQRTQAFHIGDMLGPEDSDGSGDTHVALFFNLIGGEERGASGNETFLNYDPSDAATPIGRFPLSDHEDARRAIESAAAAAPDWGSRNIHERAELVHALASLIDSQSQRLVQDITQETGKTLAESAQEVAAASAILRRCAALALEPEGGVYRSTASDRLALTRLRPLGVVVAITPFNFPLALPCWKLGPALMAGNACVFKPSELSPRTGTTLGMLSQHAGFPLGVLNVLHGPGERLREELCSNESVAAVCYAGDEAGARKVGASCGQYGKKCQIETSGKNIAIVLEDADFDKAAALIVEGAFSMSGQKCLSTSRVAVASKIARDFCETLKEKARKLALGDPRNPRTYIGPMISERAVERLLNAEREAISMGAGYFMKPAPLPPELDGGHYAAPRILINVPKQSALRRGALSGPLLSLYAFKNLEEAVKIANETPYGLSASIITRDLPTGMGLADRIEAGIVRVNSGTTGLEPHIPFSGAKGSGVHSASFGREAFEFFCQPQTLLVDYGL